MPDTPLPLSSPADDVAKDAQKVVASAPAPKMPPAGIFVYTEHINEMLAEQQRKLEAKPEGHMSERHPEDSSFVANLHYGVETSLHKTEPIFTASLTAPLSIAASHPHAPPASSSTDDALTAASPSLPLMAQAQRDRSADDSVAAAPSEFRTIQIPTASEEKELTPTQELRPEASPLNGNDAIGRGGGNLESFRTDPDVHAGAQGDAISAFTVTSPPDLSLLEERSSSSEGGNYCPYPPSDAPDSTPSNSSPHITAEQVQQLHHQVLHLHQPPL